MNRKASRKRGHAQGGGSIEDKRDLVLAARRLREIERDPSQLVTGPALERRLAAILDEG